MSYKLTKSDSNRVVSSKPNDIIDLDALLSLKDELVVTGNESKFGPPKTANAWRETVASVYLPFSYAKNRLNVSPGSNTSFPKINVTFNGTFRPNQPEVYKEAMEILKKHHSVNLALHCGFGKTMMGIKIWTETKLKGIALCHRKVLIEQWQESLQKFTNAKVQVLKTDTKIDETADFYIINMITVPKRRIQDFTHIGFLIVDEAHICCAEKMSRSLTYFCPKMCLALTATPVREDGMNKILDLYFGTERIVRIAQSPFVVYKYSTGIVPKTESNPNTGSLDWNSVIKSLVENDARNQLIVDIVKKFSDKTILILSKHVKHVNALKKLLEDSGVKVTKMCSSETTYDTNCRVLLSTYSKLGVGFDDSRLDMLISSISVKEIEQYAGRLRDNGRQRIIVDLVDEFAVLFAHWNGRKKWYQSRNGWILYASVSTGFPPIPKKYAESDCHDTNVINTIVSAKPVVAQKRLAPKITF